MPARVYFSPSVLESRKPGLPEPLTRAARLDNLFIKLSTICLNTKTGFSFKREKFLISSRAELRHSRAALAHIPMAKKACHFCERNDCS